MLLREGGESCRREHAALQPARAPRRGAGSCGIFSPERRRTIAEAVEENYYVEQGFAPWISGAAALVVVCTREDDYHDRYRQPDKLQEGEEIAWPVPYWYADAGAAAMLIMLAAIDEGLAAGVFGIPAERMERNARAAGTPT